MMRDTKPCEALRSLAKPCAALLRGCESANERACEGSSVLGRVLTLQHGAKAIGLYTQQSGRFTWKHDNSEAECWAHTKHCFVRTQKSLDRNQLVLLHLFAFCAPAFPASFCRLPSWPLFAGSLVLRRACCGTSPCRFLRHAADWLCPTPPLGRKVCWAE